LNINLVFLLPYSPDLNPIEFIWKSALSESLNGFVILALVIESKVFIRSIASHRLRRGFPLSNIQILVHCTWRRLLWIPQTDRDA
jgi:transposase